MYNRYQYMGYRISRQSILFKHMYGDIVFIVGSFDINYLNLLLVRIKLGIRLCIYVSNSLGAFACKVSTFCSIRTNRDHYLINNNFFSKIRVQMNVQTYRFYFLRYLFFQSFVFSFSQPYRYSHLLKTPSHATSITEIEKECHQNIKKSPRNVYSRVAEVINFLFGIDNNNLQ